MNQQIDLNSIFNHMVIFVIVFMMMRVADRALEAPKGRPKMLGGAKAPPGYKPVYHGRHIPRSTIPEPYASEIRRELRRVPTWKLREVYHKLKAREATGIEVVEKNRAYAISAIEEVLWERGKLPPGSEQELLPQTEKRGQAEGLISIPLTPKQVDTVYFRFLDVGHEWVRLSPPIDRLAPVPKKVKLLIPRDRIDEALDILDTAVDITRDWVYEPVGRAEHMATVSLYEKVKRTKATLLPQTKKYLTLLDAGDTTFKEGEVVFPEAYERENRRVKKLGLRPAFGKHVADMVPPRRRGYID